MQDTNSEERIINKNLILIFSITLTAVMGVASITPAFPLIMEHFEINAVKVGLLITAFTIPGFFLAPFMGVIADLFGRKAVLIPSLFLFGIAGFACFFTHNWVILLVFRFFQGIGAASLSSLNITLIGDLFSGSKRAQAMGYNASVLSIGTAAYPFLGGSLAVLGWNFPFVLPILAIPVGILMILYLDSPAKPNKTNLKEYLKRTFAIINQPIVWILFVVNVMLFVIIYGVFLSYFPIMMKDRFTATSFQIGLCMSGFSVMTAITASQLGKISKRFNPKQLLMISFTLYSVAMLFLNFAFSWQMLVVPLIAFGMGHGLLIPTLQNMLVGFAPITERAAFMSVNSMVLRFGQTIGPITTGAFFALGGISYVFLGGSLIALCMLILIAGFINIKP